MRGLFLLLLLGTAPMAHAQTDMGQCLIEAARQPDPMVETGCIGPLMEFEQAPEVAQAMTEETILGEADKASDLLSAALRDAAPGIQAEMAEGAELTARALDQCAGSNASRVAACRVSVTGNNLLVIATLLREHLAQGERR